MLTPIEAARSIVAGVRRLPPVRRPLPDALDHVLASDVISPIDIPPWDNSAMDGFAVRSTDCAPAVTGQPVELRIVETVPAGAFPSRPIGPGEATRIFTGAPLPEGCDGVIRQEDTTRLDDRRVRIENARDAGRNVRRRAEDIRKHSVVLAAGTPLGPAQLGLIASIAQSSVDVYRRPRVAIVGSGDEIVDLDQRDAVLAGRKVASSNTYTLLSMIRRAGAEPVNIGIARDDPGDVRAKLEAAAGTDLIVTSAGVSVGEHDHIRHVLGELGADLRFWRIRMRPGAPVGFGIVGAVPWIGLPGNPVSTMVTFELFVRPAIRKMLGHTLLFRRVVPVTVGEPVRLGPRLRHYLRAIVRTDNGRLVARLTGPQGSGILTSMALANALLIVPEEQAEVAAGEVLSAIMLE
jgi:molybdopterin molybdotransferase